MRFQNIAAAAAALIAVGAVNVSAAQAAPKSEKKVHRMSGTASWYQSGHRTASGARYNPDGLSAAHRTLPFGTRLKVTNRSNGKTVHVVVNDRGPFIGGRVIDVSRGAARQLGMMSSGTARVEFQLASN
ncbi:septal ring lytic transglycosylase RlpA family protein [Terrihabitans sp. B22-R8]|uniref:septal ring lytic transglycosylase RlpA family protein n=1 Tax=Terrihabitans sp. B22-R8 TaxID=3425128 RepID=UPI00403C5FBD